MIPSLPIKATTVLDTTNIDLQPTPRVTLITKLNADEPVNIFKNRFVILNNLNY
jgi:hypothetical protein